MFMWESGFLFIRTFALKNFQPHKPSELHYFSSLNHMRQCLPYKIISVLASSYQYFLGEKLFSLLLTSVTSINIRLQFPVLHGANL